MEQRLHRLLLLNPPSSVPVFRDCYCSGYNKGPFFIHPLDLQMQSGFFNSSDFQLEFVDAIFEKLGHLQTLERIRAFAPDSILSLVGHAFLNNDAIFLGRLKSILPKVNLYLSGDIARFSPEETFVKVPQADGLLMDCSSPGLCNHLKNRESSDLITRNGNGIYHRPLSISFSHPLPRAEVIKKYEYRLPFFKVPRYYSIVRSFGCPFSCTYCNTHLLGYRVRDIDEFIDELYFASSLGYKSMYIRDATFLYDKEHTLLLFKAWERTRLKFQWICFTRPDLIDQEVAEAASTLGCCLMMLGVESFDESCLKDLSRNIDLGSIENAFKILRKKKIPSAAQIILGLQNLNIHSSGFQHLWVGYEKQLREFLKCIDPDYLSLNVYSPRPGVNAEISVLKMLENDRDSFEKMAERIARDFYFRSRSIQRQIGQIGSVTQFAFQVKTAFDILLPKNPLFCRRS